MDNLIGNLQVYNSDIVSARINAVPARQQKFAMQQGNVSYLFTRDIRLWGVEALTREQLTRSIYGDYAAITQAASSGVAVTFAEGNEEKLNKMAVPSLIRSLNGGFIMLTGGFQVNLTKSYIYLVDTAGLAQDEVLQFQLYYTFV